MRLCFVVALSFSVFAAGILPAQEAVPELNRHERVLAIVKMVGSGTKADPKRPAYTPLDASADDQGILAYSCQTSDDNQWALCEFVARNRVAFRALAADRTPGVVVFDKGRVARTQIEAAFRLLKQNFNLDQLRTVLP